MKEVYSFNPRLEYHKEDFEERLVDALISLGYDAEWDMGISQMRVFSNAPQDVARKLVKEVD